MGGSASRDLAESCVRGDGIALCSPRGDLTRADLRERVRAESAALVDCPPRSFVVIVRSDTAGFLATFLAAWCLDLIPVPLDPAMPAPLRARLVERVGAAALVDEHTVSPRDDAVETHPDASLLLFTSGTSGAPKGVLLGAEGLRYQLEAIAGYLPMVDAGRVGLCSPLFYSYGLVGQALASLRVEATLVDLLAARDPLEQLEWIRRYQVRGLSSVPTHLRRLARLLAEREEILPLDYCALAGASLDAPTQQLLDERFAPRALFRQYGLTEAAPRVAAISSHEARFFTGSVGKPLPGILVQIRDEEGHPLPSPHEGEVHVKSPSVMLGYLHDAEATRATLGTDGFLRTGDRGSLDEEGHLTVVGRADGVIKCGGERVSLENVQSALRALPGVHDAVALAIPHAELGHAIVAFVEPEMPVGPLRAALRERLVPAARPSRVVAMASLPRTATGKIALAQLQQLAGGQPSSSA